MSPEINPSSDEQVSSGVALAPVEDLTQQTIVADPSLAVATVPTPQPSLSSPKSKRSSTQSDKPILALYLIFAAFIVLAAVAYYAYTKTKLS